MPLLSLAEMRNVRSCVFRVVDGLKPKARREQVASSRRKEVEWDEHKFVMSGSSRDEYWAMLAGLSSSLVAHVAFWPRCANKSSGGFGCNCMVESLIRCSRSFAETPPRTEARPSPMCRTWY